MDLTKEEKREYALRIGKGGIKTLAVIDRLKEYLDYREEDRAGSEFMNKILTRHAELMNRCYDALIDKGTVEQKDVISLREHLVIIKDYVAILSNYETRVKEVKEFNNAGKEKKPIRRKL